MTRVSSESSSSCNRVVPPLSAASSSTRLEMLFEPGSRTVPAAPSSGGTSRKFVANISAPLERRASVCARLRPACDRLSFPRRSHAPVGPDLAGLFDQCFDGIAVAGFDHGFHGLQHVLEQLGLGQQLVAVRQQDVAPPVSYTHLT